MKSSEAAGRRGSWILSIAGGEVVVVGVGVVRLVDGGVGGLVAILVARLVVLLGD